MRCDGSQTTSRMARIMCNLSHLHNWNAPIVPQYLANFLDRALVCERQHCHSHEFVNFGSYYAVASIFADDYDTTKSTTSYVIFMAEIPFFLRSKLQISVVTLMCKVEYAAIFEATKDYYYYYYMSVQRTSVSRHLFSLPVEDMVLKEIIPHPRIESGSPK